MSVLCSLKMSDVSTSRKTDVTIMRRTCTALYFRLAAKIKERKKQKGRNFFKKDVRQK